MATRRLHSNVVEADRQALEQKRAELQAQIDRLTEQLNLIQAQLVAKRPKRARTATERRRDALAIAQKSGPRTVAAVKKMKFTDTITEKQKSIARQLAKRAQSAREKHTADAA